MLWAARKAAFRTYIFDRRFFMVPGFVPQSLLLFLNPCFCTSSSLICCNYMLYYSKTCSCTCFGFFILTHSNKYMIIASAWSQLLFFSKYIKFQSGKRFGHRCGPSSVPDLFKSKNIKILKPLLSFTLDSRALFIRKKPRSRFWLITHRSIRPGTNSQMALVISNLLRFLKELTFKWHVSDFHVNQTINIKATMVKVTLLLHLCLNWL